MKSLKGKMVIFILIISVLPIILISIYSRNKLYDVQVRDTENMLAQRTESAVQFIDSYLQSLEDIATYLSKDANVIG